MKPLSRGWRRAREEDYATAASQSTRQRLLQATLQSSHHNIPLAAISTGNLCLLLRVLGRIESKVILRP